MKDALQEVKDGVIDGIRGVGCASIHMTDGRMYGVVHTHSPLVERYSDDDDLIERLDAKDVEGEVEEVRWAVDELGGIYY